MRLTNADFRKLTHSIKYIEFYWALYNIRFPNDAPTYQYVGEIEAFIKGNKYQQLVSAQKSILTNDRIISKKQRDECLYYASICEDIKKQLAKDQVV